MGLTGDAYARMMKSLLPPGRLWRLVLTSILSRLLFACAEELARVHTRAEDLLRESDPRTTLELLPDFERQLDLPSTGTIEERRARVIARLVRRQRYRPVDFQVALAPLLGLPQEQLVVIERMREFCVAVGDDREIFRFFIFRDPALPGEYFLESAQELVDKMAPSHTRGHVIESIAFKCDDPHSLCDRDILGA